MVFNPLFNPQKNKNSTPQNTVQETSMPADTIETPTLSLETQTDIESSDARTPLPKQVPVGGESSAILKMPVKTPFLSPEAPKKSIISKQGRRIGDILLAKQFISEKQLGGALAESKATGNTLGTVLIRSGLVTEEQLGICLAELHGLDYINSNDIVIKPDVMSLLPTQFIKANLLLPHKLDADNGRLEVVITHPDNTKVLDDVALMTRYRVIAKVSTSSEMTRLIDHYYSTKFDADNVIQALTNDLDQTQIDEEQTNNLHAEVTADSAPVVQFVNVLLNEAVEQNASDIHIEPQPQRLLIRFRVDGILREVHSIGIKMAPAIISRLKVMAKLDVSERRRPQDGRLKHLMGSVTVDMRLNTIPLQYGEKMVIRVLKMNSGSGQLNRLGLSKENYKRLNEMIHSPHGIILVTGPTGSGKTTTLYAALRKISTPESNISTIEDPVEYVLAGVNQMQVQPKAGLTFASALRALLRQDPDVIMLGEIRDAETLEAALQAAMTGHLVLSTVHANSCAKTVARLLDMGAPAYLVSTSVIGIVAQRLVRALCPHCKEETIPSAEDLELLGSDPNEDGTPLKLYAPKGCPKCDHSGFKGRQGIYEIMSINRDIAKLIDEGASTIEIEDAALQNGMRLLSDDAKRLIRLGITTTKEVRRTLGFHGAS